MVLLSQMFRSVAITGRTDASWFQWVAGRQGGRWADQQVRAAFPPPAHRTQAASAPATPVDPVASLRNLTELRESGVVTGAEFESLRSRLGL